MAQTPKTNKQKRTHVPALRHNDLIVALDKLQDLAVDDLIKQQVGDVLRAASNPNAESIQVVMKTLEAPRRKMIEKTARGLRELNAEVMARGKATLEGLSDDEWTKLIERAD